MFAVKRLSNVVTEMVQARKEGWGKKREGVWGAASEKRSQIRLGFVTTERF